MDVPAAVEPNLDKMDLHRLLQDLPKYKPWLSALSWEAWEKFRAAMDELNVSRLCSWDLPKLVSNAITSAEARKEHVGTSSISTREIRGILLRVRMPRSMARIM